jgi:hypothetical protein
MIILDFGSGNTCQNNEREAKAMIDALAEVDPKRKAVIKWQLWDKDNRQGDNITLDWLLFHAMAIYAYERYGYKTTASVFDVASVDFLQTIPLPYEIPFIKIACNKELYYLEQEVKRKTKVLISRDKEDYNPFYGLDLFCVKKYPAKISDYEWYVNEINMVRNYNSYIHGYRVSDHTTDLQLYKHLTTLADKVVKGLSESMTIEMHYALKGQRGLDVESGVCKTPEMLKEIL